jgi:hypothetical protein
MASGSRSTPPGPFHVSDNTGRIASRPTSKLASVVDLGALQSASRVLQDQFLKDAQIIPELGDMLTTRSSYPYLFFLRLTNAKSWWTVVCLL